MLKDTIKRGKCQIYLSISEREYLKAYAKGKIFNLQFHNLPVRVDLKSSRNEYEHLQCFCLGIINPGTHSSRIANPPERRLNL